MSLNDKQFKFTKMVSLLILFAYEKGYTIQLGDARATQGHKNNSLHYVSLAIDINLFKGGRYLQKTEDHKELGLFWESVLLELSSIVLQSLDLEIALYLGHVRCNWIATHNRATARTNLFRPTNMVGIPLFVFFNVWVPLSVKALINSVFFK